MDSIKDTQKQWLKVRFHETPIGGPEAKKVKFSDLKEELETQFVSTKFSSYTVSQSGTPFPIQSANQLGNPGISTFWGWVRKFQLVPPIQAHPAHMILHQLRLQINLQETTKPVALLNSFFSVH